MPSLTFPITSDGPVVTLGVAVSGPRQAAMKAAGMQIPPPIFIQGLIDTGASCTCICSSAITKLGLQATGVVSIHTPSTGSTPQTRGQFDVAIAMLLANSQMHLMSMTIPVIEADFTAQKIDALIGRDILSRGLFFYNGTAGLATISF